ncbi:DUF2530 domain-containing protein [Amycolatopsis cynarae]|uniref:DUF2530 domain-containing protein n=1 Tax=Amycolatopsis cynarae TaxID=2995223 RepID=A0ABY7B5X0_9PSEU|nr:MULTISPECIES: DUF2530 domain-containing protein [Amycolatopsis]WAL66301.1 DUF2530 domain-containing protein [Amycolatopsis sp. HUAS 11-8]
MTDPSKGGDGKVSLRPVPELPARLTALFPIVVVGCFAWLAGVVAFAIHDLGFGHSPSVWLWTCVAGVVLSLIGMGIMTWQRAAARRGSRSAQTGI